MIGGAIGILPAQLQFVLSAKQIITIEPVWRAR